MICKLPRSKFCHWLVLKELLWQHLYLEWILLTMIPWMCSGVCCHLNSLFRGSDVKSQFENQYYSKNRMTLKLRAQRHQNRVWPRLWDVSVAPQMCSTEFLLAHHFIWISLFLVIFLLLVFGFSSLERRWAQSQYFSVFPSVQFWDFQGFIYLFEMFQELIMWSL